MQRRLTTAVIGFATLLLVLLIIVYAEGAFTATMAGLELFALIVLPSLLPFFIISEILYGTGMIHFLGVLFEPLMRPLFNVPGVGSFVLSMGLAAGYPMDAVLTAKFRKEGLCTRIEAERMLAFSNTADPLFIFGAVAVGMFTRPEIGVILAIAHYSSSFIVGIIFRFHGLGDKEFQRISREQEKALTVSKESMIRRAFQALYRAREEDGRSFGVIINEAITESTTTLIKIMCFIVMFSVLLQTLDLMGAGVLLKNAIAPVLNLLGISVSLTDAILKGIFEIDLGAQAAAIAEAPFFDQLIITSGIIAWSGFSVHGQVASILTGTDIRMWPYLLARVYHAVIAAVLTIVTLYFYPDVLTVPVSRITPVGQPVWLPNGGVDSPLSIFFFHLQRSLSWAMVLFLIMLLLVIALMLWQGIRQRISVRT